MANAKNGKAIVAGLGIDSLLSLFMTAAALGPMLLLVAAAAPLFAADQESSVSYEYWVLLIVLLVLGIAFLMARAFSSLLTRQIRPLVEVAAELAGTREAVDRELRNDVGSLADKFDHIESVLFDGRTAALARIAGLEEENRRLKAAADRQAAFMSSFSHEIRTPLSAIVSAARIIQRYHDKDPEVIDRFGRTIIGEGNRLVSMISDMVDLVRIESGRLAWQDSEIRPAALVGDAVSTVAPAIKRNNVTLRVDVPERLPSIWGDRKRLIQVLDNLLRNAAKHTPAHGRIDVSAREHEGAVEFTVKDTGVGIPEDEVDDLFETSLKPSAKKDRGKQAGSGLGLALCREIVARHGGRIRARNGRGCGAEFRFEVPGLAIHFAPELLGATEQRPQRVLLLMKNSVLADCAVRALRLADIESRVCSRLQDVFMLVGSWTPDVAVVSPTFAWQLTDSVQERIRKLGVSHILMFSQAEGFVEMSPPTHIEPLLAAVGRASDNGGRVLVVEDDPDYGGVIDFELSQAGYDVERAYNGVDAVAAVTARPPDVLVLDLALPLLDGTGVLEALQEKGLSRPSIVLTSLDDPTIDERLEALGAIEVFRKYELIQARSAQGALRVKEILTPVLAENPGEVSREAGVLSNGA